MIVDDTELKVFIHDVRVSGPYDINSEYFDSLEVRNRGGTDFRPTFKVILEKFPQARAIVWLTDGYGSYPEKAPPIPVLWALTRHHRDPPWGSKIYVDV